MFLILVGPHEFGHFAFAKLFKVGVYEFSLGLGTRLWSTVRSGTQYSLALIPFGGFVRLAGMEPGDYDAPSGFHSKPPYQRVLILLAGPLVNFLMAALIWTGGTFTTAVKPVYYQQEKRYLIGISTAAVFTPLNAVQGGILFPVVATKVLVQGMVQLVTGQIPGGFFGQQGAIGVVGFGYYTYQ